MRYRDEGFARCRLLLAAFLVFAFGVCVLGTSVAAGSDQSAREVAPAVPGSGGGLSGAEALAAERARASQGPLASSQPAGGSSASGESSSSNTEVSLTGDPLSVGGEWLMEGEGQPLSEAARRSSPEAVARRAESQTAYEELDPEQAAKVAAERFPRIVDRPAGGPPTLPAGERIVGYPTSNSAQLELSGGRHGVLESLKPIAVAASSTTFAPVDLGLSEAGGEFRAARGLVGARIPKRLSDGVSIPELGVSLTPVDASSHPLSGSEGSLDGSSVLYANTQTDTDTLAKPTTEGLELDSFLRSVRSPEQLYFAVGMPAGSTLQSDGRGGARVVREGQTIADVPAPAASDAAGTVVPVQTTVAGHTLVLTVKHPAGEYEAPIAVDPNVYDTALPISYGTNTNWHFHAYQEGKFESYPSGEGVVLAERGNYGEGEHDELQYEAHGAASVMYIEEESRAEVETVSGAITKLEFAHGSTIERSLTLGNAGESYPRTMKRECVGNGTCGEGFINEDNEVRFMQTATNWGLEGYGFWSELFRAEVGVRQEKGPEAYFNTSESNLSRDYNRQNVLDSNGWLGGYSGAFEVITKDPGLGVSSVSVRDMTGGAPWKYSVSNLSGGKCAGVWCTPEYRVAFPYSYEMAEGNNTIELCAEDAANMQACTNATVKVDNTPPSHIKLNGLAESGAELNATAHQVTVEATDQTSGIKSIAVSVDGKELDSPPSSCTPGECTASRAITLRGEELGAGEHHLDVTATDYAGNVLPREYTFAVRDASPVHVGPGTVDPVTGQFSLAASDVSGAATGHVSRVYRSRSLTAGVEGPLGPQWSLSMGAGQSIRILQNGNAELSTEGQTITFASDGKGGFISPKGDGNVTLEAKMVQGKVAEYLLKEPAAGGSIGFRLPAGSRVWVPHVTEGPGERDKTRYGYKYVAPERAEYSLPAGSSPTGVTAGPDGNLWFTDYKSSKIGKSTTQGAVSEYALPAGSEPVKIAAGSDGALWFTESGSAKIGRITTSGQITEYALPASTRPWGIASGPDGNMWFTEEYGFKVGKITTSGQITEYPLPANSYPTAITNGPDGNLWFTDYESNMVGKITTAGQVTEYALPGGGRPLEVAAGPDGNLWFTEEYGFKIGKITTQGQITEYGLPSGSYPVGIAAGAEGTMWFTEYDGEKVGQITTQGQITEYGLPAGSGPYGIAVGPGDDVWFADFETSKIGTITTGTLQPTAVLAPYPTGVSCAEEKESELVLTLARGCRALTFNYAKSTTATGQAANQWGDYKGRLTRVYVNAWNTATQAMKTVEVAHYLYDASGHLRAEWDPRLEPEPEKCVKEPLAHGCLTTAYGYDPEGHLTSLTPPGQEGWAFIYGAIARDNGSGRLLKATRAAATAKVWSGEALSLTSAPSVSGTPIVGARMATSDGQWAGEPVSYAYQWEDCNAGGAECAPIVGAANANYAPRSADVGHTLIAEVTATNGSGSMTAVGKASAAVASTWQEHSASKTQLVDGASSINAVSCVPNSTECVLGDSKGNAFYATNVSATGAASWKVWSGPGTSPSEAVACPSRSLCLFAAGSDNGYGGNMYYATSLGGAWTQAYSPANGVDAISCTSVSFCLDGQNAYGYFRYSTNPASTSWELEDQGSATMKGAFCLSSSFCALADNVGRVHVATTESQVKSSAWTETSVDGTTALNGIACTSTSSCVAVDSAGNVLNLTISGTGAATVSKQDIDATNGLTAVSCVAGLTCVAVDSVGNVFVSANAGGTWKKEYAPGGYLTSVSCASSSLCVTVSTAGNVTSFDPTLTQPLDETSPLNAVSCVPGTTDCVVSDGKGNAFYATNVSAGGAASWHSWTGPGIGPSEAVDCPSTGLCLLAAGEDSGYGGNMYYATSLGGAWTQAYSPSYGVDAISCPSSSFCADGQDGGGYFRWSTSPASSSWNLQSQGSATMKGVFCLAASFCALADSNGSVHVATSESQVKSSSWTETSVDGTTALNGIACTSTSSCVAVDNTGNVLNLTVASNGAVTASKQNVDGSTSLTAVTCTGSFTCTAVDSSGNVFASTNAGGSWSREYQLGKALTSVSCASSSLCATVDTAGRVTAFNPNSGAKGSSSYTQSVDGGSTLNAVSCVPGTTDCVLGDGNGNAFYATNVSTSSTPSWKAWAGPGAGSSRALGCPASSLCVMAATTGLYYATALGGAWTQGYGPYPWDAISCSSTSFCAAGEANVPFVAYSSSPASTSWKERSVGGSGSIPGIDCLSSSFCAAVDSTGHVRVTTTGPEGTWTETDVDGSTALRGIACTSTSSCVAVDGKGNVLKLAIAANGTASASTQDIDGTNRLNAVSCSGLACAAVDAKGSVLTSTDGGETWYGQYAPGGTLTGVSCASASLCVTVSSQGEATAFNPSGVATEAAQRSPQPGATIEYGVPVSGEGAPHQITSGELAKWAQKKDLPSEAIAIFPPDEPMGWPASDYRRAVVDYLDTQARMVNRATPSGGIATTEYNALNEVERTLSADNRATALKESCESELKCNSAKTAEALSSMNVYNPEGTQLLETYGPEHKIRLANGTEEETRDHQQFSYNEGAPSGESHNLVTKTAAWAQTGTGQILAKHETVTSYSGQKNLGWTLRKPTLVASTIEGRTTTKATTYDATTGNTVETAGSVSIGAPVYASQFGQAGSQGGQFSDPSAAAIDKNGNLWVTDTANNRVDELTATGAFIQTLGFGVSNGESKYEVCTSSCRAGLAGNGAGEFSKPRGIAINTTTGNIYVVDQGNDRIEELGSKSEFLRAFGKEGTGKGELLDPVAVAINPNGNVWVGDFLNNRVDEFSETGEALGSFGTAGEGNAQFKGPYGVAFSDGSAYVVDQGNARVEIFTLAGVYSGQFGTKGTGNGQFSTSYGISSDPVSADLYVTDGGNSRIEQFDPSGTFIAAFASKGTGNGQLEAPENAVADATGEIFTPDPGNNRVERWEPVPVPPVYTAQLGAYGSEAGQFNEPRDIATAKNGNLFVLDSANGRVQETGPEGKYNAQFGSNGTGAGQMSGPSGIAVDSKGNIWIADTANNRIDEFNEKREFIGAFGFGVSDGESKLEVCTTSCRAGLAGSAAGQLAQPRGIGVPANGTVYVSDTANNRIEEYAENGTFRAALGFGVNDEKPEYEVCTSNCKTGIAGSGNGQLSAPSGIAIAADGGAWVVDTGNNRVQKFNEKNEYASKFGAQGTGNGQLDEPQDIATTANGNLLVANVANDRVQEFAPSGAYIVSFATKGAGNGQLEAPQGVAIGSNGALYVADTKNSRVEQWTSAPRAGNDGAHDTRTVYYTAGSEAEVQACQNHPEWTGLVCQTEPVAQPGDSGPPPLPVTATTYNIWDEPETITEKIGAVTRTTKKTYDNAGRETSSEETSTSTEDKAMSAVTNEYSAETGALTKQSETVEGKIKTVTNSYNTLGQLATYTDAEGGITKYRYDIDGRVEEVGEPKGKQTYTYDTTTGFMTKLVDSAAGTFTAIYDIEGNQQSVLYPDGLTSTYTQNAIGQRTSLEYIKTTNCTENCVWFKDTDAFGSNGELAYQTSSLSTETYQFNEEGQIVQTQETQVGGKGCVTRLYEYSQTSGERIGLTTREPNEKGECSAEGGLVEGHFYDTAGRLIDPGISYDALGNMTKVPALDAGGKAITSSFYVDNQVATQEQNGKTIGYSYDPVGRSMTAKSGTTTTVSHYAGPGNALTWTCEEEGKKECEENLETKWTRNVPGLDGALDAIQTNGGVPVLQLHDLQGNIVATAADNETETKLLSTQNNTEFGVPTGGSAPKYSWLGGEDVASELGTGVITNAGATYVPQLACTLQTEQAIPPGAEPIVTAGGGVYATEESGMAIESGDIAATNTLAEQRAKEAEALAGSDPSVWGLLTGKEATEFAGEVWKAVEAIKVYLKFGCKNKECETAAEADIESDTKFAVGLEWCAHHVKEGHRTYKGKTYTTTKVCLVHLNYGTNYLKWFHAENGSQIWIGESLPFDGPGPSPWGNHGPQEWFFGDVEGKEEWWKFGNKRGWWRDIIT